LPKPWTFSKSDDYLLRMALRVDVGGG
jgi:hypothetical protein